MKYLPIFLLLFSFSVFTASAQNASSKLLKIEKSGVGSPADLNDDFMPILIHAEAPFPGGNPDKMALAKAKAQSAAKYPKKIGVEKTIQFGQEPVPQLVKGYITNVGSGIPSDNYLAVSDSNRLITVANSSLYIHNTAADTLIKSKSLQAFANSAGLGGFNNYKYDPKIIYDPIEDKFISVILNGTDAYSRVVLGFSQSNDPMGLWNFYVLAGNPFGDTTWYDYPALALTDNEFFLTGNQLHYNSSWQLGFKQTIIYQIRKADGYAGNPLTSKLWNNINYQGKAVRCLYPVKGGSQIYGPNQYFLSNRNFAVQNDSIFLLEVTDTVNSPNAQLNINLVKMDKPYGVSPDAPQPGIPQTLATNDGRVLAGFYENDEIQFLSNSIDTLFGSSGVYHGTIKNIASGTYQTSSNIISMDTLHFGYPNLSFIETANGKNKSIISFNYSSTSSYPGLAALYCGGNTYSNLLFVKKGESSINKITGTQQRWGDYSGSQRIWNELGFIWICGIYGKTNSYGCYAAKLGSFNAGIAPEKANISASTVFPNPASEYIEISFTNLQDAILNFEIMDLNGKIIQRIYSAQAKSGKNIFGFSIHSLAAGTYFLRISSKDKMIETHKFIKN